MDYIMTAPGKKRAYRDYKDKVVAALLNHRRKLRAIVFLLLLTPAQCLSDSQENKQCLKVKSEQIDRVDDRSKRVFVQINPGQISTQRKAKSVLLSLQEKIAACYPHFGKEWRASFFSDEKYAVYKSEFGDNPSIIDGWRDHYVGEYDRKGQKMTLYPTSPKMVKYFTVVIP
jgi:hypothetical protein